MNEGNYNPYTKVQRSEDTRLKQSLEKHYVKLRKMEQKKYRKPHMSEALLDIASLVGCPAITESDALSRHEASLEQTSDDDLNDADKSSLFSKFTATKRPAGFFGTQVGEIHNHSGEINVTLNKAVHPKKVYKDDAIDKSDQKEYSRTTGNRSPVQASLTESNLKKLHQQQR